MMESKEGVVTSDEFETAYKNLLAMLDDSYKELVRIHKDLEYVNPKANSYQKALREFLDAQDRIFRFKELNYEVRQLIKSE